METFRHTRSVLENKRLCTVYPQFFSELLAALFTIGPGKKAPLYATAKAVARKYILNWEGCRDLLSMRKI